MADFVYVMKQRKKMCDKYLTNAEHICVDCPLHSNNNGIHKNCNDLLFENSEKALEIINKWVIKNTDHSKFKYPSWREWWFSTFPNGLSCPSMCMIKDNTPYCDNMTCDECISMPIPDDIAKKIGIVPIEYEEYEIDE